MKQLAEKLGPKARYLLVPGMIEHVRKVLGHESIDTTRVYAESATESVQKSFEEAVSED